MLFLKKNSVIASFRIVCLLFVMSMFYFFLRITVTVDNLEKINNIEIKLETFDNHEECRNNEEIHINQLDHTKIYYGNEGDDCKTTYLLYYASALILGAYVNFKKIYKMGSI
jgi:hypothetical protein